MADLYKKELKELEAARAKFERRGRQLLAEVQGENLSEEQRARFRNLVEQFDMTARRVLRKTDRDIERWQPVADAPTGSKPPVEQERARIRLQAANKVRGLIVSTRAKVAGEAERTDF